MSTVVAGDTLTRLRGALEDAGVEAFLATAPSSVRWLSGYTGSNGLVVLTPQQARFLTDFRYATSVEPLRARWDVRIVDQALVGAVAASFGELAGSGRRIGFEAASLPYAAWRRLDEAARAAGSELVPTTGVVEGLRAVKTPDELAAIRAAAHVTDEVYAWLAGQPFVGRTESEVAWDVERRFRELGARQSFPSIVASASQGALPHGEPRDVAIEPGTLVVVDAGSRLAGYCSDCTRTFATGPLPEEARRVYDVVLRAQEAALARVRPGTPCIDVHETARRVIGEAGYLEHFNHGTGHGVGLDVHEEPRFRTGFGGVLEPGNVVTVEPGVYLPGRFGVRIEDLVVVTDDGHEVLSSFDKSLLTVS